MVQELDGRFETKKERLEGIILGSWWWPIGRGMPKEFLYSLVLKVAHGWQMLAIIPESFFGGFWDNTSLHGKEQWSLNGLWQMAPCLRFAVCVADFCQRHVSNLKCCVSPKESRDSPLLKSSAMRTICTTRAVSVLWARSLFSSKRNVNCLWVFAWFGVPFSHPSDGNNIIKTAPTAIYGEQGPDFDSARQVQFLYNPRAVVVQLARSPSRAFRQLDWAEKWPGRTVGAVLSLDDREDRGCHVVNLCCSRCFQQNWGVGNRWK